MSRRKGASDRFWRRVIAPFGRLLCTCLPGSAPFWPSEFFRKMAGTFETGLPLDLYPRGHPSFAHAASADMTVSTTRSEEKRLDGPVQTGVIRPKTRPPLIAKITLNSRGRHPKHGTAFTRGLSGTQNSASMQEKAFSLKNAGLNPHAHFPKGYSHG